MQNINKVMTALANTQIIVLNDQVIDLEGLLIIGVSYPTFADQKDIYNILTEQEDFDLNKPKVLLYHTPTDIEKNYSNLKDQQYSTYWFPRIDYTMAKKLNVDLQLSGHTHGGQLIPFNFLTNILFDGYDYGLHRQDGFQIYISSGTGFWGPLIRTGSDS